MVKIHPSPGIPDFPFRRDKWTLVPKHARPETYVNPTSTGFVYSAGGMGDYIAYTAALLWVAKNCPYVHGTVYAPAYFYEYANWFFRDIPHWEVCMEEELRKGRHNKLARAPDIGQRVQLINGIGSNLLRLGFIYYAGMDYVPEGVTYPQLELSKAHLPKGLAGKSWVVLTPAATAPNRTVPGSYWTPIISYIRKLGMLPVLLGKESLVRNYNAKLGDLDTFGCMDLRNQTTVLEAAAAMKYAHCTLGLDNGLIHLAASTDASIVCGYNIVRPEQRRPVRPKGLWRELIPTEAELPCVSCQGNLMLLHTRLTQYCMYDDNKCIDILFENEGSRWRAALDSILAEGDCSATDLDDRPEQEL